MRSKLMLIYEHMKRANGPRGWWPVLRARAGPDDRPMYDPNRKRLTSRQRFEIVVGAILTQNTAWTNVEKAMVELHRRGALSPDGLRRIPQDKLARLIRSSGYFNQKGKELKALVRFLDHKWPGRNPMGKLGQCRARAARQDLLTVNGVGPETADSILLYALEKPIFVVDAYTRRIFGRHGWIRGDEPYEGIRGWFEKHLPRSVMLWNDYHAQIVEIGKLYCHRRRPDCLSCPLYRCGFFRSGEDFKRVMS